MPGFESVTPAISTGATAQQPAAQLPVSATPERTTASFGDWTLRCERPDLPAGAPRICEIAQAITVQGQQAPVAQIAFGRIQKSDPLKATIVLPLNVTLSSPVMLATGEKDPKPLDASWQRCLPIGCLAELPLRDELLRRLRAISEPGAILCSMMPLAAISACHCPSADWRRCSMRSVKNEARAPRSSDALGLVAC